MKKFFFLAAAVVAITASCSKSEVINAPAAETPITFNPYSGRTPETKATIATIDDLAASGFQVYAFMDNTTADAIVEGTGTNQADKPYMDKEVTSEDGENWTYSGNIYWPASNYLDFVAYGLNANVTEDQTVRTKIYYTIPETVSEQKDLLVAAPIIDERLDQSAQADETASTVNLQFSHLLSRVGFSLVTEGAGQTLVTLTQVDLIGNFNTECEVDLTATRDYTVNGNVVKRPYVSPKAGTTAAARTYKLLGEVIGGTAADDGSFTGFGSATGEAVYNNAALYDLTNADDRNKISFVANGTAKDDTAEANRFMMIYPQTWAEGDFAKLQVTYFLPGYGEFQTLTIDLKNGDDAINFEPGKSYEFKFKVSTYEIGFEATVEAWDTATGIAAGKETFILC